MRLHARPEADERSPSRSTRRPARRACVSCCDDCRSRRTRARSCNAELARDRRRARARRALVRLGGNERVGARAARARLPSSATRGSRRRRLAATRDGGAGSTRWCFDSRPCRPRSSSVWMQAMSIVGDLSGHADSRHARCAASFAASFRRATASIDALRRQFIGAASSGIARIGERLPAPNCGPRCAPPPAADRLSAGIKRTFDPTRAESRNSRRAVA